MSRAGTDTRRLYRFEDCDEYFAYLDDEQPMYVLRRLAWRIWEECPTGRRWGPPTVVAGRGVSYGSRRLSFTAGNRIELVPRQRTRRVLLHEMVHVLGPCGHGTRFVRRYVQLLARYGRQREEELLLRMAVLSGARA